MVNLISVSLSIITVRFSGGFVVFLFCFVLGFVFSLLPLDSHITSAALVFRIISTVFTFVALSKIYLKPVALCVMHLASSFLLLWESYFQVASLSVLGIILFYACLLLAYCMCDTCKTKDCL